MYRSEIIFEDGRAAKAGVGRFDGRQVKMKQMDLRADEKKRNVESIWNGEAWWTFLWPQAENVR